MATGTASFAKNTIGTTSVSVDYGGTGWVPPSYNDQTTTTGNNKNGTKVVKSYTVSNTTWSWVFKRDGVPVGTASIKEGTYTFSGLTAGAKYTLSGTLTCKMKKTTYEEKWVYSTPSTPANAPTTTTHTAKHQVAQETIELAGSPASKSITVYTKPEKWTGWDTLTAGKLLKDYLTQELWNAMITHAGKWKSYKDQADQYNTYNSCKITSGAFISSQVYNTLAGLLGLSRVSGVSDGTATDAAHSTTIAASHFTAIRDTINNFS